MESKEFYSAPNKIWRYADQAWAQVDNPLAVPGLPPLLDDALAALDYVKADNWSGDAVVIYARSDEERWLVYCCFDADKSYGIEVTSLPALIELLARLAPIATASLLSVADHFLKPLIYNVSEDAAKERQYRRAARGRKSP
jgi:hypothetical protein